ncbi:sensor domain-containing diguanylate cyclase [Phenylobacterium immobile]|uniref:sensor domain-containing diguanylate cyclase n=1 Tax=Phenylobacterium immobile TaxID=21 RepID=UPI000ADCC60D|nr:sensor domain-containing diguanylate cyclase [Phenylobacterium immobile]
MAASDAINTPKGPRIGLAARLLGARTAGLSLGALAVGAVLLEQQRSAVLFGLLVANALLWPIVAFLLTSRSERSVRQESLNLIIDSALGGVWIAVMHGALLPSALLVATLSMDKVAFGGWRLLAPAAAAQVLAGSAVWLALGSTFEPNVSARVVMACLPHLVIYPVMVSTATHRLLRVSQAQRRLIAEMARHDSLSGLLNRGQWEREAGDQLAHLRGLPEGAALLLIDIDNFKTINDRHGHLVGDQVIRSVADTIRGLTRETDVAGRYGGDEFVVVLAGANADAAWRIADRLQSAIATTAHLIGLQGQLTTSIGIASIGPEIASLEQWVGRADAALYQAKAGGRALVVAG